ncbi:MAG: hypothetical protein DWH84_01460, partial [Planctomycetota bacterium]
EMSVQLADGSEIMQRKETLTSVSAFLDQTASRQSGSSSPESAIQQTGYADEAAPARRSR